MNDPFATARWIRSPGDSDRLDRWVMFRRTVEFPQEATGESRRYIHVAADGQYRLWVNGRRIGEGPIRSWPYELFYDSHDISAVHGDSSSAEIAILHRHYEPGTGFYIGADPGLAVSITQTEGGSERIVAGSDTGWTCAEHPGYREPSVKMSNGMGYAEVYREDRARTAADWTWVPVECTGPAVGPDRRILPRDIPHLSQEILRPRDIARRRLVATPGLFQSVNLRPLVFPGERDVNKHKRFSGILICGLRSSERRGPGRCPVQVGLTVDPHDTEPVPFIVGEQEFLHENGRLLDIELESGMNVLRVLLSGEFHDPCFHFHFVLPDGVELVNPAGKTDGEIPFLFFGPLMKSVHLQVEHPIPAADSEVVQPEVLKSLDWTGSPDYPGIRPTNVPAECVSPHHVALNAMSARIVDDGFNVEEADVIRWTEAGDAEIIWDFGREVSGFIGFEMEAAAGTIVDFFCFESMHDGIIEHTFSLNNSLRYFASEGAQQYESFIRRGFRYVLVRFRGPGNTAALKTLYLRESLYPHDQSGTFRCSDARLNDIWKISRQTVALCMEDTFVDCPAYEQTYWTGDARNTAIYSYYLFGAWPLFLRGARLAARSLDRSPLIESHVPSAWQNVIPSWSFFHVIAGAEYGFYSGDEKGLESLYPSLFQTLANAAHRRISMPDGKELFAMHAWNMVDWAPMDVPDDGIIAHQNAQFIMACRALEPVAASLGKTGDARKMGKWARQVAEAIDAWFWCDDTGAYRDSLGRDGTSSDTFSIQTQLFIYRAGIGAESRRRHLETLLENPPASFVRIGSPFVDHFLMELYLEWGRHDRILSRIRQTWGNMLDHGATTCWEGWNLIPGHYTRSHCHAWSAAPALFLPAIVLGVRPRAAGFTEVDVAPDPTGLSHAEGSIPTPHGLIRIRWQAEDGVLSADISHPEEVTLRFIPPDGYSTGSVIINGDSIPG